MNYIVIEMQTTNGSTSVLPPTTKATLNEAENKYHTVLAAAAISAVETHSAALLNERGQLIKYECFEHAAQEEPEDEPEESVR